MALGLPVVLVPEGFLESLSLPVDEASSLLSLLSLFLSSPEFLSVDEGSGASVFLGSSLAAEEGWSEGWADFESSVLHQYHVRVWLLERVSLPSFWRPKRTSLTSARPWTPSKASDTDMADVIDDMAKTAASSCEGLMMAMCGRRSLCGEWSRQPADRGEERCRASWGG